MERSLNVKSLTHWGRVAHTCVDNLTSIDSDNGLSPGRRQTIIWTNTEILLIGLLGTNVSKILIGIQTFSFKKMHLKISSGKWRPFCLGLNVLIHLLGISTGSTNLLVFSWEDCVYSMANNHYGDYHIHFNQKLCLIRQKLRPDLKSYMFV